ncbi:MAG: TAXI family TRAP transporter solute-binding subunit, partial [Pseudomonadota bacterium]
MRWGHASAEPGSTFVRLLAEPNGDSISEFASAGELLQAVRTQEVGFALLEQPAQITDDVAVVAGVYPSVLHILVRKSLHNCTEPVLLSDLLTRGSVYAGTSGSTGYTLLKQLADAHWLPAMSELAVLDNPFSEQPDMFFQFGGLLPVDAVRRLTDYCLASVGDPQDVGQGSWADGLGFRFPHLRPFILPAGLYPQLNERAVLTLAVSTVLLTHTSTDEDLVYDVAGQIYDAANQLSQIYPLAGPAIQANLLEQPLVLPIHPGAARFALRNAPTLLERYAELGAFLVALLVALFSAGLALVRMRRQARKDRIDEFLQQLLQ